MYVEHRKRFTAAGFFGALIAAGTLLVAVIALVESREANRIATEALARAEAATLSQLTADLWVRDVRPVGQVLDVTLDLRIRNPGGGASTIAWIGYRSENTVPAWRSLTDTLGRNVDSGHVDARIDSRGILSLTLVFEIPTACVNCDTAAAFAALRKWARDRNARLDIQVADERLRQLYVQAWNCPPQERTCTGPLFEN